MHDDQGGVAEQVISVPLADVQKGEQAANAELMRLIDVTACMTK